ncbi:hypothetical protein NF867_14315 [Solitalea sp. MAHUQ-68]|uniref:Thioredoxin family protein n=1 Tax=Solitalea agri TaxID=2953739 RepID=A0A9X2JD09_9SPHI|nr:hypothetical protein [Solitalea agri]MCO4294037.1 hypothetical protein [Solitalea agri]
MKITHLKYMLLFIILFINACKENRQLIVLNNESWNRIVDRAKKEEKGIILISNKSGCSICEEFESDLIRKTNFRNELAENFLIARIDQNAIGGEWLTRVLGDTGFYG